MRNHGEHTVLILAVITFLVSVLSIGITMTGNSSEKNMVFPTSIPITSGVTGPTATSTPTPTSTPIPTSTPTPSPTNTPTPTPVVIDITISAAGDVTMGHHQKTGYSGSFDEVYDTEGADYFLKNVAGIFAADDFTVVNLEGTLTESTDIRASKEWNFKMRPYYAQMLVDASVEAVTCGNNHIMDYQWEGAKDTYANLDAYGLEYAINSPWGDKLGLYETEKGIKIGFVSVNEYYDGNVVYEWLENGYHELREAGADLVFACMHWGGDAVYVLEKEQYEIGHWCIDLGYDLVLGGHPHVIQGIECYNGKYIVYSMGNFCYGGHKNPKDKDSMIFQQTFTFVDGVLQPETKIRAIPCSLSSTTWKNDFCPKVLEGEEAEKWVKHLNELSAEFGLVFDEQGYLLEDN